MTAPSQPAGGPVELARRLKALRKDRSIPQRRVADTLGVSIALISAWESETNPTVPPGSRIRDLATLDRELVAEEELLAAQDELLGDGACAIEGDVPELVVDVSWCEQGW